MSQRLGTMHHLGICVSDMQRSEKFYGAILERLGYAQGQRMQDDSIADFVPEHNSFIIWTGPGGAVSIWPGKPGSTDTQHDRYSPGLHHFALAADSREQVDDLHEQLKSMDAQILKAPAEYEYMPGYYAVFFADPDGIKLELCHTPGFPPA